MICVAVLEDGRCCRREVTYNAAGAGGCRLYDGLLVQREVHHAAVRNGARTVATYDCTTSHLSRALVVDGDVLDAQVGYCTGRVQQADEAYVVGVLAVNIDGYVRYGVTLTVEETDESLSVGTGETDGREVIYHAHVDVSVQHSLGIILAFVDDRREHSHVVSRAQMIETIVVLRQRDAAIVVFEFLDKVACFLLAHSSFFEAVPCLARSTESCHIIVFAQQVVRVKFRCKVLESFYGLQQVDVCHAACVNLSKEVAEAFDESHLLLSRGCCLALGDGRRYLVNQVGRDVRTLRIISTGVGHEVANCGGACHEAAQHSRQRVVSLFGCSEEVETCVGEGRPVAQSRSMVAHTECEFAVGNLHSHTVQITVSTECIRAAHQVTRHPARSAVDFVVEHCIDTRTSDVAVHAVHCILLVNGIFADGHNVVGHVVHQ